MIFIFSNIRYGHPKMFKYQHEWFSEFNKMMYGTQSTPETNDIFIRGDLFYNAVNPSLTILNDMKGILFHMNKVARVYIVKNANLFPLFLHDLSVNDLDDDIEEKVKDTSLFQLSKDDANKIGYNVYKNKKVCFIPNKTSPRFIEYTINEIEDIDKVLINNDFIDLIINSDLLNKAEYKNKIDIFLNNNNFNNVFYTEKEKIEDDVVLDSKNINIRNILVNNVDEDLKEELNEIFVIYDEKTTLLD